MNDYLQDLKVGGRLMTKNELKIKELQQRIDKAIEYIELWHYRNDFRVNSFTKGVKEDLLEILGDKENE